jgi:hypothetical protein
VPTRLTPDARADNIIRSRKERVQFDKVRKLLLRRVEHALTALQITSRISKLCYGLDPNHVDAAAYVISFLSTPPVSNLLSASRRRSSLASTPE